MAQVLSWRGGTVSFEGNFGVKTNWIVTSTGVTSAIVPANGDTFNFDFGNIDVDTGLTTGLTGCTIVRTEGYTGRIAPASYLNIACTSVRLLGTGVVNLSGNITAGDVRLPGGSFGYGSGTAASLGIFNTDFSIAGAAIVTALDLRNSQGSDFNNGTGYTTVRMVDSVLRSKRAGKFLVKGSSTLHANDGCVIAAGTVVDASSKVFYRSAQTLSGSIEVMPFGVFDVGESTGFTFSGELIRWTDAIINLDAANGTITPATVTQVGVSQQSQSAIPR